MLSCLTLRIIRYGSQIMLNNPENGVVLLPKPSCSSYWKGSLQVTHDSGHFFKFLLYRALENRTENEAEMNKCLELALYQSPGSRTKNLFYGRFLSRLFLARLFRTFRGIKKKKKTRKEADLVFVVLLPCVQYQHLKTLVKQNPRQSVRI